MVADPDILNPEITSGCHVTLRSYFGSRSNVLTDWSGPNKLPFPQQQCLTTSDHIPLCHPWNGQPGKTQSQMVAASPPTLSIMQRGREKSGFSSSLHAWQGRVCHVLRWRKGCSITTHPCLPLYTGNHEEKKGAHFVSAQAWAGRVGSMSWDGSVLQVPPPAKVRVVVARKRDKKGWVKWKGCKDKEWLEMIGIINVHIKSLLAKLNGQKPVKIPSLEEKSSFRLCTSYATCFYGSREIQPKVMTDNVVHQWESNEIAPSGQKNNILIGVQIAWLPCPPRPAQFLLERWGERQ